MRTIALLGSALLTTGCAYAQQIVAANPQAAAGGAIAVEARTGTHCVARTNTGTNAVSQRQVRIEYERILFDTAVAPLLSEETKAGVEKSRRLTDSLCPPLSTRGETK